jgi:hypothetical protein
MTHPLDKSPMSGSSHKSDQDHSSDRLLSGTGTIPFENFRVQGVIRRSHAIPVLDEQAEYWTVIGYIAGQEVCGIGRFVTRPEAEDFASSLDKSPSTETSTCRNTP